MKKLLQSKISLFSSYFFLQGITGCWFFVCLFCFLFGIYLLKTKGVEEVQESKFSWNALSYFGLL